MNLFDWMPTTTADYKFFSTERDPHITVNGYRIEPSIYVADFEVRPWRERLFSIPWKPFQRTKPAELAYIVDKTIIVSWKTFKKLRENPDENVFGKG